MVKEWNSSKQRYYDAIEQKLGPTKEINKILIRLVERRSELGMTQKELAEKCGLQQSAIARIENFSVLPRLDTLIRIFRVLGLEFIVTHNIQGDKFRAIIERTEKMESKGLVSVYYRDFTEVIRRKQSHCEWETEQGGRYNARGNFVNTK